MATGTRGILVRMNPTKTPESLDVIYDSAVKQFDFVDRLIDGLTARAASVMGWTSIVLTAVMFIQAKLPVGPSVRMAITVTVAALSLASFLLAFLSYKFNYVDGWPRSREMLKKHGSSPPKVTKFWLLSQLIYAIEDNKKVVEKKKRYVNAAIWCSAILIATLLSSTFATFCLSGRDIARDTASNCCRGGTSAEPTGKDGPGAGERNGASVDAYLKSTD